MATCWNCGKKYSEPDLVTRESECPHCAAYLRCCRGCEFYDPAAYNECHEPEAELVADKEVANSCDYYRFSEQPTEVGRKKRTTREDLDNLFKD